MKTPGISISTTLRFFVLGAVLVIAMLCSLAVFGVQHDRIAREQVRQSQCSYLRGALQTAQQVIATPLSGYSESLTRYYQEAEASYIQYLQQQLSNNGCTV